MKTAEIEIMTNSKNMPCYIVKCYDSNSNVVDTQVYYKYNEAEIACKNWSSNS